MSRLIARAEGGFEPPMDGNAHTGFRDRYGWVVAHRDLQGFLDRVGGRGEVGGEVGRSSIPAAIAGQRVALSSAAC